MNLIRDSTVNISRYLPEYLTRDAEMKGILDTSSTEHERMRLALSDLFAQFFVSTATWGLSAWERILELHSRPADSFEQRRNRILLKLQSHQTSTLKFMADICSRYCTADSEVSIREDNPHNTFEIIVKNGVIAYLEDFKNAVETYKPAHLAYFFRTIMELMDRAEDYGDFQEVFALVTSAWLTDQYPWCGRYANGAYMAGALQYADGTWQADGEILANGAAPGHENGAATPPLMADGSHLADGSLRAYSCIEGHAVVYADSPEPDRLRANIIKPHGLEDYLRQEIVADGVYHAGGAVTAWGELPQDKYALKAKAWLYDSLSLAERFVIVHNMLNADSGGTARLYYADGRFTAGPGAEVTAHSITANGECFANGVYVAYGEACYTVNSDYTMGAPLKIANGFFRADGKEKAGAVPLYGVAGAAGERFSLEVEAGQQETITADEIMGLHGAHEDGITPEEGTCEERTSMVFREGQGMEEPIAHSADGSIQADGRGTAGSSLNLTEYDGIKIIQSLGDSLSLSDDLSLKVNLICQEQLRGTHHYWCDGSYFADGGVVPHIPMTESMAI